MAPTLLPKLLPMPTVFFFHRIGHQRRRPTTPLQVMGVNLGQVVSVGKPGKSGAGDASSVVRSSHVFGGSGRRRIGAILRSRKVDTNVESLVLVHVGKEAIAIIGRRPLLLGWRPGVLQGGGHCYNRSEAIATRVEAIATIGGRPLLLGWRPLLSWVGGHCY